MIRGRFDSRSTSTSEGIVCIDEVDGVGVGYGEAVMAIEADWAPGEELALGSLLAAA